MSALAPALSSKRARGVALMLASAGCFTANVLLVRELGEMHASNVWLVSCARFVIGLGLVMAFYRDEFQPRHLVTSGKLILRGVAGGIGVYVTYLTIVKLGAGRATFIGNTYVVWGALLAHWMLKERLHPGVVGGGLAAVAGLGLLTNVFSSTGHPGLYDFLAFSAAWISAYVVVTIRQLHATEHTATIFAAQCAYGLVICVVPGVLTYEPVSPAAWGIILLASVCAGTGQLTMTRSFRDLPVAEGSLLQMLVPLGTATGGILFFGERFAGHEIAGAALIFAGTAFTMLRRPDVANLEAE
jgi:drug/metabolite transporter (DMT)-like permease